MANGFLLSRLNEGFGDPELFGSLIGFPGIVGGRLSGEFGSEIAGAVKPVAAGIDFARNTLDTFAGHARLHAARSLRRAKMIAADEFPLAEWLVAHQS